MVQWFRTLSTPLSSLFIYLFFVILIKSTATQAAYRRKGFGGACGPGNEGLRQQDSRLRGWSVGGELRTHVSTHRKERVNRDGREAFEISNPRSAITSTNKHTFSTYPSNAAEWGPGAPEPVESFSSDHNPVTVPESINAIVQGQFAVF